MGTIHKDHDNDDLSQFADPRVTRLTAWQRRGYEEAVRRWREGILDCDAVYGKGFYAGKRCRSKPGKGTTHEGIGRCIAHGGARGAGRAEGAWLMAHRYAAELDISPWEALLKVVRITAGKLAYVEEVIGKATSDEEIDGTIALVAEGMPTAVGPNGEVVTGKNLTWWVQQSWEERRLLARVSKMAIDAGVAQLLISQEIQQGQEMAAMLVRTLQSLEEAGLSAEMLEVARNTMRSEILALTTGARQIEGEVRNEKPSEGGHVPAG